ncbi:ABC transporter ATP-binding protein [Peptostreptococcus equinus]|uniref:ABC transporter ATP-binding protein n=1 Tax=Peptostreptococcus equinus TaxID=3003601 RepID=A0ABY7JMW4_9FIRM|nr:ABC transporter ATP-binding protein [Peptostreptococcus sp. CBA3647]WAW14710.1 ABC transporter ATP-binding protein [Peptostreptococcus sp. CBA3647]
MPEVIKYENVSKIYKDKKAVDNINLSIRKGEFLTIIGGSGSGKTTLMKMINGLVTPDEGRVLVHGQDIKDTDVIELRKKIGYAIQGNVLFPHMTVEENISYVPKLLKMSKEEINDIVNKNLEMVDLPLDIRKRYPSELSGGQVQRVGIARSYASSPDILLMDEPFGAVDAITRYQLQREMKKIHKQTGITIVLITHDILEALKLGTKVLVMDNGIAQQFGTPEDIKERPATPFVKDLVEMGLL